MPWFVRAFLIAIGVALAVAIGVSVAVPLGTAALSTISTAEENEQARAGGVAGPITDPGIGK